MMSTRANSFAMVFPGQGSQSVGMLAQLAQAFPQVGETFAQASEVLGYDLWQRVQEGPAESLNQTTVTQPAMLAAGVAVWRCWQATSDAVPAAVAGHSLGEYSALVCAGALDFAPAVGLVAARAQAMQSAVPEGSGAMAAILGLDDEQVIDLCARAAGDEVVSAVNFNSPGQVVIAGDSAAVERAMALAGEAGARRALRLPVSVPSHCALMRPAAEAFATALAATDFRVPQIPVLHNVDVASHDSVEALRAALSAQLYQPVRWVETIRALQARRVERILEMGPGKVLTGLNKRIEKSIQSLAVQTAEDLQAAQEGLT